MKKLIIVVIMAIITTALVAKPIKISSPNKLITMELFERDQQIMYRVTNNNQEIIAPSVIKWSFAHSAQPKIDKKYKINKTYPTRGVHSLATDKCNGAVVNAGRFSIEVRAYNDGVAWRYTASNNEKREIEDHTEFTIPEGVTMWSQPNVVHYEGVHTGKKVEELKSGERYGCVVTLQYPNGVYATTTEGGLFDFAGMSFTVSGERTFRATLAGKCVVKEDVNTPWRIVMTGDLNTLVNCDIVSNVSPEAKFPLNSHWIKPGRSVWSWLTHTPEVSFENMKQFSKQASELGFEYNLVDEGWAYWKDGEKDCWDLMKELVEYSDSLGVKIWAWKAYPDRKGVEGIYDESRRRAFFAKCKELGIVGVKIDFFDSENQQIIKFYEDALADAAQYEIMLNFHGANKPAGQSRTYPNEMTREAIRGTENRAPWAGLNTIMPFTRMLAGHADFTPIILPPTRAGVGSNNRQTPRVGEVTPTHHFASAAIYTSPILCYGVNPEDLLANPACEMVCSIPAIWDETIVLDGSEIGESVIFARRNNGNWFLTALTLNAKSIEIPLSFLSKGEYVCDEICDNKDKQWDMRKKSQEVNTKSVLKIDMNNGGGYIARITPQK